MNNKYWFEPKRHGWGFTPSSWEGWLATLVLMILLLIILETNGLFTGRLSGEGALRVIFDIFIVVGIFTVLMRDKVKTGLGWRWGFERKLRRKR